MKERRSAHFRLSEKVKTLILCLLSAVLFMTLAITVFKKAGSDAYKKHCSYDSYTLQALAWRRGEAKLDGNHPNLELAIVNREWLATHDADDYMAYRETFGDVGAPIVHVEGNEYYVSFPPVPSVPMLLVSFFTGGNTPDNLFSLLYVLGAFIFSILICRRMGYGITLSFLGGVFACVASGAFFLGVNKFAGGPWFAAQTLAVLLTTAAFYFMLSGKNSGLYASAVLLALGVGCRPFVILYFFLFAYVAAKKYDFKILKTWRFYIAPAVIGGLYMLYNYVRFGDVFEFGHNYLPEFMRVPDGQFSLSYVKGNAVSYFKTFPYYKDGELVFSHFGFTFWVANPIYVFMAFALVAFLVYGTVRLVRAHKNEKLIKTSVFRDTDAVEIALTTVLTAIYIFLLLMHKTAGGWQFGMRYTVDTVPAALLCAAYCGKPFLATGTRAQYRENTAVPFLAGAMALAGITLLLFGCWLNVKGAFILLK